MTEEEVIEQLEALHPDPPEVPYNDKHRADYIICKFLEGVSPAVAEAFDSACNRAPY